METNDVISRFETFIHEANELADAFSETGKDDNSYDTNEIVDEATKMLAGVMTGDTSLVTASSWLDDAQERLDNI